MLGFEPHILWIWSQAFLLTQLAEVPIYMKWQQTRHVLHRFAIAFGASLLTHPILWFCLPWKNIPMEYMPIFIFFAESCVVFLEGTYFWLWGLRRPFLLALLGNIASVLVGEVIKILGWNPSF